MHKVLPAILLGFAVSACGGTGLDRDRPDEFAVARQAPLVIPPDYSLVPPQPGVAPPQARAASDQAVEALFGGPAPRSAAEQATLRASGGQADAGVRSAVGSDKTMVIDKGAATDPIVTGPATSGTEASTTTP